MALLIEPEDHFLWPTAAIYINDETDMNASYCVAQLLGIDDDTSVIFMLHSLEVGIATGTMWLILTVKEF